jgi:radical SAM superfamily enzyme YgiQ (UPF0313 family)
MRIALIFPAFLNSIQTTLPEYVDENEGYFQPLGLLYIASYLKKYVKSCDVKVIDSASQKLTVGETVSELSKFSPDIVGISCWTFSLIDALKTAKEVKAKMPNVFVCLGGPHATIYPQETIGFKEIDFLITGDGEYPFAELVNQLSATRDFKRVPNLYYKENGNIEKSPLSHSEKNLDDLPFPDRTLVPIKNYYSTIDKSKTITTMITSRGCPFKCKFCFQQDSGWRHRETPNIIKEMEECVRLGIKNFFIFDETFTVNKKRALDLCDEIIRRKMNINWSCRSRVDTIDVEVIERLKEAGCSRISFGVESASEDVLRHLNKKISISRVKESFRIAGENRLITLADFMIGCPGENRKASLATIKLAIELNSDYAQFSLFTLLPATELYREALRDGVVKTDVWLDFAENPSVDFKPPLWNIYREDEARKLLSLAYKRFYLRPGYLAKRLFNVRSFKELTSYIKAGIGLITAKR